MNPVKIKLEDYPLEILTKENLKELGFKGMGASSTLSYARIDPTDRLRYIIYAKENKKKTEIVGDYVFSVQINLGSEDYMVITQFSMSSFRKLKNILNHTFCA